MPTAALFNERVQFVSASDDTLLALHDLGGQGPPAVLLHGLAGHAGEWQRSVPHLAQMHRIFALDQRGHGNSERRPSDVSREAYIDDVVQVILGVNLGAVTLIGQSMGANTAFLTAARHPQHVSRLVVIEGSPTGPDVNISEPPVARELREWLLSWPVPFATRQEARGFFSGEGLDPDGWAGGLEARPGGLWPRFDVEVMVGCIADLASRSYWNEWRSIGCPTLVILGEHGMFSRAHGEELVAQLPGAELVTIAGAGHDVHLDAPEQWVRALGRR